jgi:endoglucanase
VRFAAGAYEVREGASLTVTVLRDDVARRGEVRYAVWPDTARTNLDFPPTRGRLDFAPGQAAATFTVTPVDDGNVEGRETAKLGLYGAHPEQLGRKRARLTILDNDRVGGERDDANPLALDPPPPGANPLKGADFFRNPHANLAGTVIRKIRRSRPTAARLLRVIAAEPETKRFGSFNAQPKLAVARYLERAQNEQPGSVPLLATYRLAHINCGRVSDTPAEAARYKKWYRKFAEGIGNHRAVVFLEIDALITAPCLSSRGLRVRIGELRSAIDSLARLPHAVVYVDAGASDAHHRRFIASLLRKIGVHRIQGFFTNATHQNKTKREIAYGRYLSRQTGGSHFVINTATNGRGALRPRDRVRYGNSIRCNAPGRGLGPRPTADVPARHGRLDGLFWIANPGRSAGPCVRGRKAPPTGTFWLDYAIELVRNADFRIR